MASSSEYNLTSTSGSDNDVSPTLFLCYRPIILTTLTSYWQRSQIIHLLFIYYSIIFIYSELSIYI